MGSTSARCPGYDWCYRDTPRGGAGLTARLGTVAGEAVLVVTDVPVVVVSAVCRSRVRLALDG